MFIYMSYCRGFKYTFWYLSIPFLLPGFIPEFLTCEVPGPLYDLSMTSLHFDLPLSSASLAKIGRDTLSAWIAFPQMSYLGQQPREPLRNTHGSVRPYYSHTEKLGLWLNPYLKKPCRSLKYLRFENCCLDNDRRTTALSSRHPSLSL